MENKPRLDTPTTTLAQVPSPPLTTPTTTAASRNTCTLDGLVDLVATLLNPHAIPLPPLEIGSASLYTPNGSVSLTACASRDVVAHEVGHYVMQRANGSFTAHIADAALHFCPGGADTNGRCSNGWIRAAELYPGIEHAAHCVGNVLAGYGPYTKCPEPDMYAAALDRIKRAV